MAITRTPMIDDDGSGTTGTILNNAWKQELYGQIDAFVAPPWVTIPFASAQFSASGGGGGIWTVTAGNVYQLAYVLDGNSVTVIVALNGNMTLSATATVLSIKLPNLPAATRYTVNPFSYLVATQVGTGHIEVQPGPAQLYLYAAQGAPPWPAASTMYLMGQITYPCG